MLMPCVSQIYTTRTNPFIAFPSDIRRTSFSPVAVFREHTTSSSPKPRSILFFTATRPTKQPSSSPCSTRAYTQAKGIVQRARYQSQLQSTYSYSKDGAWDFNLSARPNSPVDTPTPSPPTPFSARHSSTTHSNPSSKSTRTSLPPLKRSTRHSRCSYRSVRDHTTTSTNGGKNRSTRWLPFVVPG